jgi:TonB family protein
MLDHNLLERKSSAAQRQRLLARPISLGPRGSRQQGLMMSALVLLLVALGVVLYLDRDFWFPETMEADDQLQQASPVAASASQNTANGQIAAQTKTTAKRALKSMSISMSVPKANSAPDAASDAPFAAVTQRTALPPLEVEVVAGDAHRVLQPGSNSIHVDLQPGSSLAIAAPIAIPGAPDTTAAVTSNAAERVETSGDATSVVSHSVRPDYPMLARQMKVQGSVVLEALIGREGRIQTLRVISGPPILANAAQEAVRQWHFKPHFEGTEMVETRARITVNFTISTN